MGFSWKLCILLLAVLVLMSPSSVCWGGQLGKVGMYLSQGRPDDALTLLDSIIASNPKDIDAYSSRAFVKLKLSRHKEAIDDFSAIITLQPDNPDAYLSRGMVYDQLHDVDRAASDFRQACVLGDSTGCSFQEQIKERSIH